MTEFSVNSAFNEQINQILQLPSPLQEIKDEIFEEKKIKVYVKRDDLIHAEISGNKWRKLKHNILKAKELGCNSVLTFGGAFSNHIYATAAAGKYFGFDTIGIIRGNELNENSSPTLKFAAECGMKLHFISRIEYSEIRENQFNYSFTNSLIVPEGGTNEFALGGVGEMVEEINEQLGTEPDYIICPVGTGGTIAGIMAKTNLKTKVLGVCVLKGATYLQDEINFLVKNASSNNVGRVHNAVDVNFANFEILWDFHHGGYAKKTPELIDFISKFEEKQQIKIEPIYSGKMFFAFYELLKSNYFKENTKVILVHTGGIQLI